MTSEEGDENPSSTGTVLNGNPPMTHVSTDVLKEFIHTLDRSKSPVSFPNSNLINSEKKMHLTKSESDSIENPVKKIRLEICSEEKGNANSVSTLPMSPKAAETKAISVLSAAPEKDSINSTLPTPAENCNNTSIVPYSNTLLLAMSSSSISLTPKLIREKTKTSSAPIGKTKENMKSDESLPFTSSVSCTIKASGSSPSSGETLTEKAFSLPKSPKNIAPRESLSDLERKIVGSVSISQKNVNKQLKDTAIDEIENIDELLNPGSPFSDTSSHISLSLEESLLRDDNEIGNEENQSSTNKEKSLKNDKMKVGEEYEENGENIIKEQSNDKKSSDKEDIYSEKKLVNSTVEKSLIYKEIKGEELNSIESKNKAVVLNNLVAQSDKDKVKTTTQDKCNNINDNARDNKDDKNNDAKIKGFMDKTPDEKNELGNENNEKATLSLVKDNEKLKKNTEQISECMNKNKQNLDEDKSDKATKDSNKIDNETELSDDKSDIVDDIFEADEASVEDGNETSFAIFDEKDDYNDDSDEETIKPAISRLIGSMAKDIREEGSDNSCSSKHSSTDQEEESSEMATNHIKETELNVKEDECKSNSSSKEISTSLRMYVNEESQSSTTMSTSSKIEEDSIKEKSQPSKISLSSANVSAKETSKSSINVKEADLDKRGNTKEPSSLTFTEALKAIEADSLKSKLEPLKPSAEFVSTESLSRKKSLTVLQPVLKRPIGDISSERDCTSSLKKMRFFKNDNKDPLATQDSDTEKDDHRSLIMDMDKCLQKEKNNFSSTTKHTMNDVDPEELRRRTALELEKVKPPKSISKLHRVTRKELETLVLELFMDKLLYEDELGQQRDLCKRLEATLETNRKKAAQFHKEVEDLKKVTQRLQAEHLARKGQVVAPVKVKRSVGIQATPSIIGKGLMHASSGNNTIRLLSPSKSASRSSTPTTKGSSTESNHSTTASGNKSIKPKPAGPKRQSNNAATTTSGVQTNSIAVGGSTGKMRQIQTTRVVVSQPVNTPSSQVNTSTNSVLMMNSSQKIITTGGSVSALIPTTVNTCYVRAAPAQIAAMSPTTQGILGNSSASLPVANIVQRVSIANNGGAGLIDLTDDDDKGVPSQQTRISTAAVLVPRSAAGTTSQLLFPHQPQMGQLLLVPSSNGNGQTALVVGQMPGATQATIMNGSPNTIIRPNILSSNPQRLTPGTRVVLGSQMNGGTMIQAIARPKHPAPLPEAQPQEMGLAGYSKKLPPVPILKLSHKDNSIVLSWNMIKTDEHDVISSYQLFAYQEGTAPPSPLLWKKVGSVKALELPMACTLTQFMPGHVYHFAVRAVDAKCRSGPFSEPKSIRLQKQ